MSLRAACSLLLLVALTGCAGSRQQLQTFNIAGGFAVDLPMTPNGAPIPTENDDFRIELAGYMLDNVHRELLYTFAVRAKKGLAPRSVTVEDVTGVRAEVILSDAAPELGPDSCWRARSNPRRMGDPSIEWVNDLGDTYKVFRFSITTSDGRPFILHQAAVWAGAEKAFAREVLGFSPPRGGRSDG